MPPSGVYTSEELAMLSRVLDESLKMVVEHSGTPLGLKRGRNSAPASAR
jgi:hypothetical protein